MGKVWQYIKKPFVEISNIFVNTWAIIEEQHVKIFHAGVVLFGVSLGGLSQVYPKLIEFDYAARELQYTIEAQEREKLLKIDCMAINVNRDKCLLAQYQHKSNQGAFRLSTKFTVGGSVQNLCHP